MTSETKPLARFMEYVTLALFLFSIACVAALPWVVNLYLTLFQKADGDALFVPMLSILYPSGLAAILVLWQLRCILSKVSRGNPFTDDTVRRLRIIAVLCGFVAVVYLAAIFFLPSVLIVLILIVFAFLSAMLFILGDLFQKAVAFKEENDLTI